MKKIEGNIEYTYTQKITEVDFAITYGSGNLCVLATPALVAFMERAAHTALLPFMDENEGTVGISININHLNPTLDGMNVYCTAKLRLVEGRKFIFDIEAKDEVSVIGTAVHERFLINTNDFIQKAYERKLSAE